MGHRRPRHLIAALWQLPLALLSLGLFWSLRLLSRIAAPRPPVQAPGEVRWRPLGPCAISTGWERLRLHLSRPLWDAHAVIAQAGPFHVDDYLRIQVASATCSARTWQMLVRDTAGRVAARIIGADIPADRYWHELQLPAGDYLVETHYYGGDAEVELPRLEVDKLWSVPPQETSEAMRELYHDALVELEGLLSRALHYHVHVGLRFGAWLDTLMGPGEMRTLPGSGQTRFDAPEGQWSPGGAGGAADPWIRSAHHGGFAAYRTGALERGEALQVEVDARAFRLYDVYLTLFTPGGVPTAWQRLQEASVMTQPRTGATGYVIQLHRRGREADPLPEALVSVGHLNGRGTAPIRGVEHLA